MMSRRAKLCAYSAAQRAFVTALLLSAMPSPGNLSRSPVAWRWTAGRTGQAASQQTL